MKMDFTPENAGWKGAIGSLHDFAPIPVRAFLDKELGAAMRVLGLITAHVGKDGTCYPSQSKIARDLGISRQAVSRSIHKLEKRGYIQREHRTRENGSDTTCLYRVLYAAPCQPDVYTPATQGLQGGQPLGFTPPATSEVYTHNIPFNKPLKEAEPDNSEVVTKLKKTRQAKVRIYTAEFLSFWKAFPHGDNPDKTRALDQWNKILAEGITSEQLMQAVDVHKTAAEKTARQYRKRAHTWLEGRVWEAQLQTKACEQEASAWTPF